MRDAEPRLSIANLATIELMRTDSDYARYCEGVDDRVDTAITAKFSKDADAGTAAQNLWMPRLIAQRAKLYCQEVLSIPVDRHVEQLRDWFFGLGLFGVAVPHTFPTATIIGTDRLELTVMYSDVATPTRKARPNGVGGCEVFCAVADNPPTNPEDYRFVASSTRTPELIKFKSEDGGKTANILLRWVNTIGEPGPWSQVASATIPAV